MKKYSEFINFPIYLWATKEVDVEVPAEEDDSSDDEEKRMSHYTCESAGYTALIYHILKNFI